MRDPDTGNSKGYAFINFASFDASDAALEAMNGQHLCNRPITISYAFKKDAKGERHGGAAGDPCLLIFIIFLLISNFCLLILIFVIFLFRASPCQTESSLTSR